MGALPQSSARPFNRKLGFVYAKYFANHRHNAALPRSYFLDQLCQADRREKPETSSWRDEDRYPSNLTDAEWERLTPLIPEASPGGRPRKTDMRAAMGSDLKPPALVME